MQNHGYPLVFCQHNRHTRSRESLHNDSGPTIRFLKAFFLWIIATIFKKQIQRERLNVTNPPPLKQ